ncbi:MAG TPA: ATP-grasp domain-containing protein [Anaeromyxobacter sp.]
MNVTALVTGVGGPAGRAAAEWFTRRGLAVVGADMREVGSPAASFRRIPSAAHPDFAASLLALVEEHRGALLVPTVSEELPLVARLRPQIVARGCALAMGGPGGVEVAADKLLTAEALARRQVAVPLTLPAGTPRARLVAALGLPMLAKPRLGRGGRGVRVLRTPEDVTGATGDDLVFQEFVPGDEFDVNLFAERTAEIPAAVVLRKTALRDGETGNAAGVERIEHAAVRDEAIRAVRALELAGPLDVDVRLRRDGSPAVLEVNARLGANVLSAAEVLESLLEAWRAGRCN